MKTTTAVFSTASLTFTLCAGIAIGGGALGTWLLHPAPRTEPLVATSNPNGYVNVQQRALRQLRDSYVTAHTAAERGVILAKMRAIVGDITTAVPTDILAFLAVEHQQ